MADSDSNFLSRWSQRKQAKKQGVELVEPAAPDAPSTSIDVQNFKPNQPLAQQNSARAAIDLGAGKETSAPPDVVQERAEAKLPAPTMADAQQLTPQSDFKPFMRADVSPEVKNAAMKQLFKDPHFNVMDMMDVYVDDYSKPDPLPPEMLRKMAVTQFLGFWEETEEEKAAKAAKEEAKAREDAEKNAQQNVAQSEATELIEDNPSQVVAPEETVATASHTDDHTDLQLQPDDAARREGSQPASG
jgi:Protein of unknown function (DUF3306)